MYKHTIGMSYKTDMGTTSGVTNVYTDNGESGVDVVINANTSNVEVDWAFVRGEAQCLCISADQDLTIETNAIGHSGGDQIDLKAIEPVMVTPDRGTIAAVPITHDITKLYVTNGNSKLANLKIRALLHLTTA